MSGAQSTDGPRAVSPAVNGWHAEYLDSEYQRFKQDSASVTPDMAAFFRGFDLALAGASPARAGSESPFQSAVDSLIGSYRLLGHLAAKTDPFGRMPERPVMLTLAAHGLTDADLDRAAETDVLPGRSSASLREIIAHLESAYCGSIGTEFQHIPDDAQREWFLARLERAEGRISLSGADRSLVLEQLTAAESFDKFLGKRYQGKKRFSLEGGESLIPLLKWLTTRAGELGTEEIILGMAHRGRLSVLKNFLGKDLVRLFTEFEDSWSEGFNQGGGDVKYHRGYSGDQPLPDGRKVHLSMLNNPSHLESVNPIVMGRCRAKQDHIGDTDRQRVVSLLIHGDAAVAGQGVVAECLTMSGLEGYEVGGTIHVVANNLVGFTTDPIDSRSSRYCTDIAKMINAPVIHVNGDDPEAVVESARIAADFRARFKKDIFIDLVCYRRFGHNEQDEPNYTQPLLYALIRQHPGTPEVYRRKLVETGAISAESAQAMIDREMTELDAAQTAARTRPVDPVPAPGHGLWAGFQGRYSFESPKTAIPATTVAQICAAMGRTPDDFNVHPKLKAMLQARAALPETGKLSHADAEQIAVGALLLDGIPVRLSGQDCRRGTFTQRHAVLRDEKTGTRITPLNSIAPQQKTAFKVWDSPLSEYAVMGFDYGYSRGNPKTLVMWEGQFGDFVNGAQTMIDQYLASSEVKWSRWAGLVLLLPHGYEGQGPEHSSARLERFLQLCADENMEVIYPSTGAQIFHALRRQALRNFRKPLIVMTPKKFLRVETSNISELSSGEFMHLIDDAGASTKSVKSVLYCSGKIYHELNDRRTALGRDDVAIVRVEQMYPFHSKLAKQIDARYPASATRTWVQEEPRNQGAFLFMADVFREQVGQPLAYIGRPPSASPATGSEYAHKREQEKIMTAAIGALPAATAANGNGASAKPEAEKIPAKSRR